MLKKENHYQKIQKIKINNKVFIIILSLLFFCNAYSQNYPSSCIKIELLKYVDIPYLIFFSEVSNSCDINFKDLRDTIFISSKYSEKILNPFYVSESFKEIQAKKKVTQGIFGFRGMFSDTLILYIRSDTLTYKLKGLPINNFDDYKYEAYALALILAVENYKEGDTLVSYYYKNYFSDKYWETQITQKSYLYFYLKGSLIVAQYISKNNNDDNLGTTYMKEICENFERAYEIDASDEGLKRSLFKYYIKIARYYYLIKEENEALKFYGNAKNIIPAGVQFEYEDEYNYAVLLYKKEKEIWVKGLEFSFDESETIFKKLADKNFKKCECLFKLGQISYMKGYDEKNFDEAESYFKSILKENCSTELQEDSKENLRKIEDKRGEK